MKRIGLFIVLAFIGGVAVLIMNDTGGFPSEQDAVELNITPNWAAIEAWPALDAPETDASPDPNRQITAIVLDDSGSMGSDIEPAKAAVLEALNAMQPDDLVAVIALNAGVLTEFEVVPDALNTLRKSLPRVRADGTTPLARAVAQARNLIEAEGAQARAFGSYRLIVTTDGAADNPDALTREVEALARETPIQIATIGIGIRGNHVLRRPSMTTFVDVANVNELAEALSKAIAESQSFDAVTSFNLED